MTLWLPSSGVYRGKDHALRGINRQDESICGVLGDGAFGFVADGCGEGRHSEIAARISVEVAARTTAASESLALTNVAERIVSEVVTALRATLAAVAPREPRSFIADHLCATLLGFVVRADEAVLLAVGDGLLRVDEEVTSLDAGPSPSYPAYALLGGTPRVEVRVVRVERAIAVATDGVPTDGLRSLAPRSAGLTRHLVLMERRGELFDDGGIAMAVRQPKVGVS